MAASPTRPHQRISFRLAMLIDAVLPNGIEVIEGWGWKPGADEFIPDVTVFDDSDEQKRLTATPHLAVEVLSTDPAADIIRKAANYAAAGLPRIGLWTQRDPRSSSMNSSTGCSWSAPATVPAPR